MELHRHISGTASWGLNLHNLTLSLAKEEAANHSSSWQFQQGLCHNMDSCTVTSNLPCGSSEQLE